jgi:hypothetical protein
VAHAGDHLLQHLEEATTATGSQHSDHWTKRIRPGCTTIDGQIYNVESGDNDVQLLPVVSEIFLKETED